MKNILWCVNHFILKLPSELAYLQCIISFQDCELHTKIYSSWKSTLKMGILPSFCLLFLTEFFSDNIKVAMERSRNHLWLWKALEARVGYCLWKNQFIKTKLKLRQEAKFLVGTSVSWWPKGSSQSWLCYKMIKASWKIVKARSFTTHFKEGEIKGYMWEETLRSRQEAEGKRRRCLQSKDTTEIWKSYSDEANVFRRLEKGC